MTNTEHGTYGGWSQHRRHKTEACEPCRLARNAYVRERRRDPEAKAKHTARVRARETAQGLLAREYPVRYRELYEQACVVEFKKRGIEQ